MTRMSMDDIKIMCEELAMSGTVSGKAVSEQED